MADKTPDKKLAEWPEVNKWMLLMGLAMLGLLIVTNLLVIIRVDQITFGNPGIGPNSIYASKKIWIAYHSWGIITAIGIIITWILRQRLLFMIFLLLLLILMFYPYFTH